MCLHYYNYFLLVSFFFLHDGVMDNGSIEESETRVRIPVEFIAFTYILIPLENVVIHFCPQAMGKIARQTAFYNLGCQPV